MYVLESLCLKAKDKCVSALADSVVNRRLHSIFFNNKM